MEDTHSSRLEEIDRQQRQEEKERQSEKPNDTFAANIEKALNVDKSSPATPLFAQEEIEDEEPSRINLTAVICTAIVAICATVILCIAQPWKNGGDDEGAVFVAEATEIPDMTKESAEKPAPAEAKPAEKKVEDAKPAETKPAEVKVVEKKEEPKAVEVKVAQTLPVLKVTTTGTNNPYNSIRLVDASSRVLTKDEVAQMNKSELALARNAIYARHGYKFKNAELKEFFDKQSWFKPTNVKIDSIPFSKVELDNIRIIKAQESVAR